MTSFPDKALLEEVAAEMEERERRKQELQERKDAVKRDYLQAVPTGGNGMDLTMLHTARPLREAVDRKAYGHTTSTYLRLWSTFPARMTISWSISPRKESLFSRMMTPGMRAWTSTGAWIA